MPSPLELPPGLTTFEALVTALNERYRQLAEFFKEFWHNPGTSDYSMGNHRIIQVADPNDDLDVVNLRTLRKFGPQETEQAKQLDAYTIVFASPAALVDDEDVDAFVVGKDRSGAPEECWLYSRTAAPGDVSINFGIQTNPPSGPIVNLLTTDLTLPSGTKGPVFATSGFKAPSFPRRTVVYPIIVSGSSATLCSMGIVVKRK